MSMDYYPGYAGSAWAKPFGPVPEASIAGEYAADVIVLGAGHAGTAAARAAAEAGASVIVVEQQAEGKFTALGGQIGTLNSEFLKRQGVPAYDPVDFIRDYQHRSLNRANPELIRQFAWHSGEALDWFLGALPDTFIDHLEVFMWPAPKYHTGSLNGIRSFVGTIGFCNRPQFDENGEKIPTTLSEAVVFLHGKMQEQGIRFHYGLRGRYLEKDAGRVNALIAVDREGKYHRFQAKKAIILASGDFSGDKEMVFDLLEEYRDLTRCGETYPCTGGCWKGDGIKMGIWAGGHMEPGPRGGMWCNVAGNGGPMDGSAFLKLNQKGERYTNEGFMGYWGAGLQGARQRGPIVTVWDANWREELEYQSLDHSSVDVSCNFIMEEIETGVRHLAETGSDEKCVRPGSKSADTRYPPDRAVAAGTLEELADKLGYTGPAKENFLQSIQRYNCFAHNGRDEDFAKDPLLLHPVEKAPFFAYQENRKQAGMLMVTVAGLQTDGQQRVLNDEGDPIPGLFATGNCCGGRFPIMYTTPMAGLSIGMALCLGRIAGQNAAEGI